MRAAIYCRVSTEEQAREGFSIAAQKKTLASFCEAKGWKIMKEYVDEGISGKSTIRPAFQELLNDAEHKRFDAVLVWKINRFSRKNADLLNTAEFLREHDINLISFSEQFDSSTPAGKLMLSILGSIGEFERDTIVENIKAGMDERARQGLFNGGRFLGYDTKDGRLVVNDEEASTVRRIYELCLSGFSLTSIRDILKSESRRTKTNCIFGVTSIKRILCNPVYAGYISYNKSCDNKKQQKFILVPGNHEPLISTEQFEAVKKILESKNKSYVRKNNYILSGILKCPECRGKMTGSTIGKYRYYVCLRYKNAGRKSCSSHLVNASTAESIVLSYLCNIISSPSVIDDVSRKVQDLGNKNDRSFASEAQCIEREIALLKNTGAKYLKLFEDGNSDVLIFSERIKEIDEKIRVLKERYFIMMGKSIITTLDRSKIENIIRGFKNIFISLDSSAQKRVLSSIINEACISEEKRLEYIALNFRV